MPTADEVVLTPEEEFDAIFNEIAKDTKIPAASGVDDGAALEDDEEKKGEKPGDGSEKPAAGGTGDEVVEETAEEKTAREAAEVAAKKAADETAAATKTRVDQELAVRKALKDADDATAAAAAAAKKVADDAAANDITAQIAALGAPELTDEQKAVLKAFEETNPEAAAVLKLQMEHQGKTMAVQFTKALATVVARVQDMAGPLQQQADRYAYNEHMATLRAKHEDYDAIIATSNDKKKSDLETWIDTQPTFLQTAMKSVYTGGTTAEMLDLVEQFKTATGRTVQPKVQDATDQEAAKIAAKKKAAIDALKPVGGSKRTTPQIRGVDTTDFDGAFAEFASDHEQENTRRK